MRHVGAHNLSTVEVICGGFPCQDISVAGKGAGLKGARSGLWGEMRRVIDEVRPRGVVVENVRALVARGMDRVVSDRARLLVSRGPGGSLSHRSMTQKIVTCP